MARAHHHPGESTQAYFTEQLLTILVCGLFGFAAVQMYRTGMLGFLAPDFQAPVLYGGIALLVLVVVRAVAVWHEAGDAQAAHVHGAECAPDCDHDILGDEPGHDHGHSHDLSWVFARMLVLVFPILLFFMGLPSASFSKERQLDMVKASALGAEDLKKLAEAPGTTVIEVKPPLEDGSTVRVLQTEKKLKIREVTPAEGGTPRYELITEAGREFTFNELNDAAYDRGKQDYYEGQTALLEGRFKKLSDKQFTLFRMKMTCCAADTVPLKVNIIVPQALSGFSDFDWVQVKGQIQFRQVPGQNQYVPVIMVADITDVKKAPPKSEYEQ
jgi:uncharacterized membrane protein YcgQ (UPF0703/DUF1980 family)